jgi:tRNA-2-methylthio-N6-dimethylallyladenosine synthase
LALAKRAHFAQAFSFKYSARPGTQAEAMENQVPEAVKQERLHALQGLLDQDRHEFDRATVGRRLKVLFEAAGRKPGQIVGRSPYLQAVHAEGREGLIGDIVEVDILAAGPNSLHGVINSGFAWREPVQAAV